MEIKSEFDLAGVKVNAGQKSSRSIVSAIDTENVIVLLDGLDDEIVTLLQRYLQRKIARLLFERVGNRELGKGEIVVAEPLLLVDDVVGFL